MCVHPPLASDSHIETDEAMVRKLNVRFNLCSICLIDRNPATALGENAAFMDLWRSCVWGGGCVRACVRVCASMSDKSTGAGHMLHAMQYITLPDPEPGCLSWMHLTAAAWSHFVPGVSLNATVK